MASSACDETDAWPKWSSVRATAPAPTATKPMVKATGPVATIATIPRPAPTLPHVLAVQVHGSNGLRPNGSAEFSGSPPAYAYAARVSATSGSRVRNRDLRRRHDPRRHVLWGVTCGNAARRPVKGPVAGRRLSGAVWRGRVERLGCELAGRAVRHPIGRMGPGQISNLHTNAPGVCALSRRVRR
jgi:hypothetical protein